MSPAVAGGQPAMTVHDTPGAPCWIELFTADTDAATRFYGDLFGWTATDPDPTHGGYRSLLRDGERVAGLMANDGSQGVPDCWTVYLESADADETVARVRAAGGQVGLEPMTVGDLGRMAMVVDPAGAAVGVWQPGGHPGFAAVAAPGAPGWFETLSTDYPASVAFYRDAFGWDVHTMSDTPDFRYSTLGEGDRSMAGIMDAAELIGPTGSSRWQFYVMVEDAHDTAARAVAAGGRVTQPVTATPYGELAALLDPAGVPFHVMG